MNTIGERIRSLRISQDKTLEQIAQQVGVSRQTIQRYESGIINNIPSDKIEAIALSLNTTPAHLMGWEKEESETNLLPNNSKSEKQSRLAVLCRTASENLDEKQLEEIADMVEFLMSKKKANKND